MMNILGSLSLSLIALWGQTSSLEAADVIRAGDRLTPSNTIVVDGASKDEDEALLGLEVKRTVYAGQLIKPENTRSPRLVTRNQIVTVKYIKDTLEISITGRAMGDGGKGDIVSIMNPQSRELISGTVTEHGWVLAQ